MKVINWLLDNVWAAVIIFTVLAQLWKAITKGKGGDEAPAPHQEETFDDPELAEAHYVLADLYNRLGRHADAAREVGLGRAADARARQRS